MPLAGSEPASRAKAHIRWAARYARSDDIQKALSHVGSALKYGNAAQAHSSKFGAHFPEKGDWRKVTVNGEIYALNRPADDEPYSAMVAYETTPNDADLGRSYLICLPVTYNENSIYAYFVGSKMSYNIGGVLVATKATTLQSLPAARLQLQKAIEDTNLATNGLFHPGPADDPAPAKAFAKLVLTKLVCDYGAAHGIRLVEPPLLRGYSELVIDGIGVSVCCDFKLSFARAYVLSERMGDQAKGESPHESLRAMREARNMTIQLNHPRSVGNIHFLQRAHTEPHRKKLDYFVASGASGASKDYQDEGKLHSLIFAPYTGTDASSRVIRDIEQEVPREFVRAGNLVNGLTIAIGKVAATGERLEIEPCVLFAIRAFVWCTLAGCEFIHQSRNSLSVSKQGEETHQVVYSVMWSKETDHTVTVSNSRNAQSTEFTFEDLGTGQGPARQKDHAAAVAAIKEALQVAQAPSNQKHKGDTSS